MVGRPPQFRLRDFSPVSGFRIKLIDVEWSGRVCAVVPTNRAPTAVRRSHGDPSRRKSGDTGKAGLGGEGADESGGLPLDQIYCSIWGARGNRIGAGGGLSRGGHTRVTKCSSEG